MSDETAFLNKEALEMYYTVIPSLLQGYRNEGLKPDNVDTAEEYAKRLVALLDEMPNDAPCVAGGVSVLLGAVIAGSMGNLASSIVVSHLLGRAKAMIDQAIGQDLSNPPGGY